MVVLSIILPALSNDRSIVKVMCSLPLSARIPKVLYSVS